MLLVQRLLGADQLERASNGSLGATLQPGYSLRKAANERIQSEIALCAIPRRSNKLVSRGSRALTSVSNVRSLCASLTASNFITRKEASSQLQQMSVTVILTRQSHLAERSVVHDNFVPENLWQFVLVKHFTQDYYDIYLFFSVDFIFFM